MDRALHWGRAGCGGPATAILSYNYAGRTAWPNGLLRGHPGLVCLALDLARGGGGFPLLED